MLSKVYLKTRMLTITIISALVGFATGIMAFLLAAAIELGSKFFLSGLDSYTAPHSFGEVEIFHFHFHLGILPLFVIPAIGGLLCGVVGYFLAPETLGGGSSQAVKAFHYLKERIATKVPFVKVLVTGLTIGSGGSGGREGPIMLIGAGMGSILGGRLKISEKDKKILIASGIGAGMSAVFMAPLGGAIFGIEVLYKRDYEVEAIIPAVIASIVSFSIYTSLLDYFASMPFGKLRIFSTIPPLIIRSPFELLMYLLLGVACGLLSLFYIFTYKAVKKFFKSLPFHTAIRPAIGGLIVGLIGWKFPYILGTGYGYAEKAIHGAYPIAALLFAIAIVKIISTTVTVGSGGSGGLFAPAVVIGCMFGGAVGYFLHNLFPNLIGSPVGYMLVGMAAMLAGAFKTPLAGIIMVLEMTGGYTLLPALAIASIVSYAITGDYTLCDTQLDTRAESPIHSRVPIDMLKRIKVSEAMIPKEKIIIVNPETTVAEVLKFIEKYGRIGFPVMEKGELVGIVTFGDIEVVPPELEKVTKVRDVMSRNLIVTYPDETLNDALAKLADYEIRRLPVVRRDNQRVLLGMINRPAIIRACAHYLIEAEEKKEK